jgi:hypothetical protein
MKTAVILLSIVFVSTVVAYEGSEIRDSKSIRSVRPVPGVFTRRPTPRTQQQSVLTPWPQAGQVPTPLLDESAPSIQQPYMEDNELILEQSYLPAPSVADSYYGSAGCCTGRDCRCCRCCPPPSVATTICLTDPCGCVHEVCLNVPACCADHAPTVTWRSTLFGRHVATLCYDCCDTSGRVIVTRRGKVIVRGQIR